MELLPNSIADFSDEKYWNEFFAKIKSSNFEWYGNYRELSTILHKYILPRDNLLVVGCGNSSLSSDLFYNGIMNQTNIDISSVVVDKMKRTHPEINFMQHDVTQMLFYNDTFTCVLDKGTYDALAPLSNKTKSKSNSESSEETEKPEPEKVDLMLEEINRVTKQGGRFVCVSLLQPVIARRLLNFFVGVGWMIRVIRCFEAEKSAEENSNGGHSFPVFICVFTKIKTNLKPVIEIMLNDVLKRFENLEDLLNLIKEEQYYSRLKSSLKTLGFCSEKQLEMKLSSAKTGQERYMLYIVDTPKLFKNRVEKKYGVFIVPQGRESEWLFGTNEGRKYLANETGFSRLAVVHLIRDQIYESMSAINEELNMHMNFYSPKVVIDSRVKAPIMTIGQNQDIGERKILLNGKSELSGDFIVEDVRCDSDKIYRRLIFLNYPNVIQSEAEILRLKKKGKEISRSPIISNLSCDHHLIMTIGFGILNQLFKTNEEDEFSTEALLIGLGGGLLASFLLNFFPKLKLTAVEIDKEIVHVAHEYFALPKEDERFQVVIEDGLKFIQSTGDNLYKVILIDVNNSDVKEGLSCPPLAFVEESFLEQIKNKLDPESGILLLNLVCRNQALKKEILDKVAKQFSLVLTYQLKSDLNEVLFCFPQQPQSLKLGKKSNLSSFIKTSLGSLNDQKKAIDSSNKSNNNKNQQKNLMLYDLEISDNFKSLKI